MKKWNLFLLVVILSICFLFPGSVMAIPSFAPVPEPATLLLLGSGLIGLAGVGRKKFFKK